MTQQEAYDCICKEYGMKPMVCDVYETDEEFRYMLAPPNSGSRPITGCNVFCVDKTTKEIRVVDMDEL